MSISEEATVVHDQHRHRQPEQYDVPQRQLAGLVLAERESVYIMFEEVL